MVIVSVIACVVFRRWFEVLKVEGLREIVGRWSVAKSVGCPEKNYVRSLEDSTGSKYGRLLIRDRFRGGKERCKPSSKKQQ